MRLCLSYSPPPKARPCVPWKPLKGPGLCCPLRYHSSHVAIKYLKYGESELRRTVKYTSCKDSLGKKNVKYLVNFYIDCTLKLQHFRYAGLNKYIIQVNFISFNFIRIWLLEHAKLLMWFVLYWQRWFRIICGGQEIKTLALHKHTENLHKSLWESLHPQNPFPFFQEAVGSCTKDKILPKAFFNGTLWATTSGHECKIKTLS